MEEMIELRSRTALSLTWLLWPVLCFALSISGQPEWLSGAVRTFVDLGSVTRFSFVGFAKALAGHAGAILATCLILLIAFGAGSALKFCAPRMLGHNESWAIRLVAGWGVMSTVGHGLALSGILSPLLLGVLAIASIVSGTAGLWTVLRGRPFAFQARGFSAARMILVVGILLVFLCSRLPGSYVDALGFHFAIPESYLRHHKVIMASGFVSWHMPRGFEMLLVAPLALGGEWSARSVNISLAISHVLVLSVVGARMTSSGVGRWVAPAVWICCGLVADQCFRGKNDLCASLYVIAAAAILFVRTKLDTGTAAVAGWLLGLAVGVKWTAAFMVPALGLVYWRGRGLRSGLLLSVAGGGGMVISVSGWLIESFLLLGNPFHPFLSRFLPSLHWRPEFTVAMRAHIVALSPEGSQRAWDWGASLWRLLGDPPVGSPVIAMLVPLMIFARHPVSTRLGALIVIGLLAWIPTERVVRYVFPVLALAVLGLTVALGDRAKGRAGAFVGAVALMFLGGHVLSLMGRDGVLHLAGQKSRQDYLATRQSTYRAALAWAGSALPRGSRPLFVGEDRTFGWPGDARAEFFVGEPFVWRMTRESHSMLEVRKRWRQSGYTHLLYNFVSATYSRQVHWPGPGWNDAQLRLYRRFCAEDLRVVFSGERIDNANGGFYIFQASRSTSSGLAWTHFMPGIEGQLGYYRNLHLFKGFQEVQGEFAHLRRLLPGVGVIESEYGWALVRRKRWREAFEVLGPFVRRGFVDGLNLASYGEAAFGLGKYELAESVFRRCAETFPEMEEVHRANAEEARLARARIAR